MDSGISFNELLQYSEIETKRWKSWFMEHPEVLDLPCDIAKAGTVRKLLLHIFATEAFFAGRLLEAPEPDWQNLPSQTVEDLFAIGEDATARFREFIARATHEDWKQTAKLRSLDLAVSKRKMLAQALLHGVHHRGQLATFLRQQDLPGMWVHDFILADVMD
jgi:uncharacterized damage-inducible protein DinB